MCQKDLELLLIEDVKTGVKLIKLFTSVICKCSYCFWVRKE